MSRERESMGAEEDNKLTLDGLAHRLESLKRENADLRHKAEAKKPQRAQCRG